MISPREIDTTRVLCSLAELEATGSHGFAVGEGDWPLRGFVVRTSSGVAAYVNYCPHAGHPLNMRPNRFLTPDGSLILCCSHGALFARDDGLCIAGPCPVTTSSGSSAARRRTDSRAATQSGV